MPSKKCYSKCRKQNKQTCVPPECTYVNGKKHSYCRLSQKYKLDDNCNPILKSAKPRTRKAHGALSLSPPLPIIDIVDEEPGSIPDIKPSKEEIEVFRQKYAKKNATRKIGRFFKKVNPNKRRAFFLKSVCSDAGVCIAFGKETGKIKKHFDNFENFAMLSKPATRVGKVSQNGFVKEFTYENEGYVANAILKSSAHTDSDNLLYEGVVGLFLNKQSKRFPCFLETYNMYKYTSDIYYYYTKTYADTTPKTLTDGLEKITPRSSKIIEFACAKDILLCVLIQHIKQAKTLHEMISPVFTYSDLLYVLYQVYMPLSIMSDIYTHYDLHDENVLLYEPVVDSHIEYFYHVGGETISFKSKYIAKIIDYGRSYFNEPGNTTWYGSSQNVYDTVCRVCKPHCGANNGFGWLWFDESKLHESFQISSRLVNQSHDLRLLTMLQSKPIAMGELKALIDKVVFGVGLVGTDAQYGTKKNTATGLPSHIHNVMDAANALKELIKTPAISIKNEDTYIDSTKLGELHIYDDGRDMNYIPA